MPCPLRRVTFHLCPHKLPRSEPAKSESPLFWHSPLLFWSLTWADIGVRMHVTVPLPGEVDIRIGSKFAPFLAGLVVTLDPQNLHIFIIATAVTFQLFYNYPCSRVWFCQFWSYFEERCWWWKASCLGVLPGEERRIKAMLRGMCCYYKSSKFVSPFLLAALVRILSPDIARYPNFPLFNTSHDNQLSRSARRRIRWRSFDSWPEQKCQARGANCCFRNFHFEGKVRKGCAGWREVNGHLWGRFTCLRLESSADLLCKQLFKPEGDTG